MSSLINSNELVKRMVDAKIYLKKVNWTNKTLLKLCNVSHWILIFYRGLIIADAVFFLVFFIYMSTLNAFTPNILFWPYFWLFRLVFSYSWYWTTSLVRWEVFRLWQVTCYIPVIKWFSVECCETTTKLTDQSKPSKQIPVAKAKHGPENTSGTRSDWMTS